MRSVHQGASAHLLAQLTGQSNAQGTMGLIEADALKDDSDAAGTAYDASAPLFADKVRWAIAIARRKAP